MKALWHIDANHSKVKTHDSIPARGHKLHVKSLYSLISMGTELLVARGQVPIDLHTIMRVPYMEGEFNFPVKYGYSLVGEMNSTGAMGHLMHPHQNECVVAPDDVFEIPSDIPAKRATLASNLETALNAIWDGEIKPGNRIVVVGFGMIGSLITRIASTLPGIELQIVEPHPVRRQYVEQMGFTLLEDESSNKGAFDVAFHTSSTQEGLQSSIDLVGFEGRVIEMSWYGNRLVTLHLGGTFHSMRKKIFSSQVSNIPTSMQTTWNFQRRKEAVFELLRDSSFDQHITYEVPFEDSADLFNHWRKESPDGLGYCIRY